MGLGWSPGSVSLQGRRRAVARQYKVENACLSQGPRPSGAPSITAGKYMSRYLRSKLRSPAPALGQVRAKRQSSRPALGFVAVLALFCSQANSGTSSWSSINNRRCLTCRSTGAPTARQPGREAQHVYRPPRGRAPSPSSPG